MAAGVFTRRGWTQARYKQACAWYGSLSVAALLPDPELLDALTAAYAPHMGSYDALLARPGHVDQNVFGIVPLEISLHDLEPAQRCLKDGLALADHQQHNIAAQIRYAMTTCS